MTDLLGTNWSATTKHYLVKPDPFKDPHGLGQGGQRTLCGKDIVAFDPNNPDSPRHIRTDLRNLHGIKMCKSCAKRHGDQPVTDQTREIDIDKTPMTDLIAVFMNRAKQLEETGLREDFDTRLDWLLEEFEELRLAIMERNEIETDDALADIAWMAIGWIYKRHGITVGNKILREVNRANIDKVDPLERMVFYPDTNKVGKFEGWRGPDHETTYRDAGLIP